MLYFLVFRIDWSSDFPFSFFLSVGGQMEADYSSVYDNIKTVGINARILTR
jgi:hypothetical protein